MEGLETLCTLHILLETLFVVLVKLKVWTEWSGCQFFVDSFWSQDA